MELIRGSKSFSTVIIYLAQEQFLIFQVFIDFVWSDKRFSKTCELELMWDSSPRVNRSSRDRNQQVWSSGLRRVT